MVIILNMKEAAHAIKRVWTFRIASHVIQVTRNLNFSNVSISRRTAMNKLIFTVAMLCCFPGWAFEPLKDLRSAVVVASGQCNDEGFLWDCFALTKEGKKYLVMVDENGPGKVYEVKEFKPHYKPGDLQFIWQRIDA